MPQTRKYFGTDGIRGRVGVSPITPSFLLKLGWALGKTLADTHSGRVSVLLGKDTRLSGYLCESALESGLSAAGADVFLVGPVPTPAVAYLVCELGTTAGAVISASHNPHYDNGVKFFSDQGFKLDDAQELAIERYLELADQSLEMVEPEFLGKATRIDDGLARYAEFCLRSVPEGLSLSDFKIVVDCAHGAAYHVAPDVLRALGADLHAIGVQPDGLNINKGCGATDLSALRTEVLSSGADLGIALDGDADRLIMVDAEGDVLDGDRLLYIIAGAYQKQGLLSEQGIVGTVLSNMGLEQALHDRSIDFFRSGVGDRHMLAALRERKWILAGEGSGHIICLDKTSSGDGLIAALQVLSIMQAEQKSLRTLGQSMVLWPQVCVNVRTTRPCDVSSEPEVTAAIEDVKKALAGRGRVILRASGTEPLMRIMVEGEQRTQIETLAKELSQVVQTALDKHANS